MNVNTANSTKEAPAKMKEWNFDALIVDLDLPDISGIDNGADFFLKKGDNPHEQFHNRVHMINRQ
jgi:DNA-binding response OmpR family regulator